MRPRRENLDVLDAELLARLPRYRRLAGDCLQPPSSVPHQFSCIGQPGKKLNPPFRQSKPFSLFGIFLALELLLFSQASPETAPRTVFVLYVVLPPVRPFVNPPAQRSASNPAPSMAPPLPPKRRGSERLPAIITTRQQFILFHALAWRLGDFAASFVLTPSSLAPSFEYISSPLSLLGFPQIKPRPPGSLHSVPPITYPPVLRGSAVSGSGRLSSADCRASPSQPPIMGYYGAGLRSRSRSVLSHSPVARPLV
ncbi:hypothetical protein B0T24DRAFT_267045 [Lasiosphaeria ovina]|uniref:Uncharacterized protein n=1 Tax=Lasiosphaeria ovina TaxID=92902 RepID=A0AAE0KBN5_9PEZI|nr:hypothetical protein B0T24DRAFT_267045 [Lasiosphaeria ovina]